ncbi:nuclear transport factor 2 family protein [Geodermatophilus sabuli]|uniref:SnoaL-like domain-containing protein n=1 Tax=Geodermatophilus sabuli TaxID=1564158 RepID=A0A285EAY2_9ACTN|nr:nuclear transport factor 2 family protein [Geodermatophilus sabuli]MBB3085565.1 hypothetical protein [Geodermatophilus sabuli]SNX96013.1 SnoaL-like domain-containing protein [Geodermatophilus sabuli]
MTGPSGGTALSVPAVDAAAIAELMAKQKLYENLALYCRGQDRKDLELVKSTFWPEATDDHGMFVGPAHEFCQWAYENQKTTRHRSHHYITNVLIELDGDLAQRESAVVYVMVRPDGGPTDVMGGRYRDLCERRDGEWKVLRRVVIFDHVAQFASQGQLGDVFGGIPATARVGDVHPKDPIYDGAW